MRRKSRFAAIGFLHAIIASFLPVFSSHTVEPSEHLSLTDPKAKALPKSSESTDPISLTNFYLTQYFSKLKTNFGDNQMGTCGYVACGMLLSFWDTYWNDRIIPENYEQSVRLPGMDVRDATESPGAKRERAEISHVDGETYFKNIFAYEQDYFHLHLLALGNRLKINSKGKYGMNSEDYYKLLYRYLKAERGFYLGTDYFIYDSKELVKDTAISYVKRGIPVKLGIRGPSGDHAVVAYDYKEDDEGNKNLYCHFGWGEKETHVTPEAKGFTTYLDMTALEFFGSHVHSGNYLGSPAGGGTISLCSCRNLVPRDIHSLYQLDPYSLPTFLWECLYQEKWLKQENLSYSVFFYEEKGNLIFSKIEGIVGSSLKLNSSQWWAVTHSTDTFVVKVLLQDTPDSYFPNSFSENTFFNPGPAVYGMPKNGASAFLEESENE